MRSFVLLAVLASVASAAHAADTRESRYGPAPERPPVALDASSGYAGPVLSWGGKSAPVAAQPVRQPTQPPVPARYVPIAQPTQAQPPAQPLHEPWRQLGARPVAATATAAQQDVNAETGLSEPWRRLGATPSVPTAQAPPAKVPLAGGPPRDLPTSIYQDAPAPVAQVSQAAKPAQLAQAQPAAPAGALPPTMARTYSVGRQYGLQPDGIPPLQPNGMVLIAPSEEPPPSKTEEPLHGSAEWLARGPIDDTTDARRDDDAKDSAL